MRSCVHIFWIIQVKITGTIGKQSYPPTCCLKYAGENSLQCTFPFIQNNPMKLTIIRLQQFSTQDVIDLGKIWPKKQIWQLANALDDQHRLFAARFNDRLLAAVCVEITGSRGKMYDLQVREVTRRRGVGQYLLEEVLAQNPQVTQWRITDDGDAEADVIAAFMQACGFTAQNGSWHYQRES